VLGIIVGVQQQHLLRGAAVVVVNFGIGMCGIVVSLVLVFSSKGLAVLSRHFSGQEARRAGTTASITH